MATSYAQVSAEETSERVALTTKSKLIDFKISDIRADKEKFRKKSIKNNKRNTDETLEGLKEFDEAIKELEVEQDKLDKDNSDALDDIRKRYRILKLEASTAATSSAASGLSMISLSVFLKLLLDFAKIFACFLVVNATMHIVVSDETNSSLKNFSIVCSGVVLISVIFGGALTYLS